jgi:hypothetical protein
MQVKLLPIVAVLSCTSLASCQRHADPPEAVAQTSQAVTALSIEIDLPAGVAPDRTVLAASETLRIEDHASVTGAPDTVIANVATQSWARTDLGEWVTAPTIESVPSVRVDDDSQIAGDLTTSGTATLGTAVTISGALSQSATLTPLFPIRWTATPPSPQGDVYAGYNQAKTLAPGAYDDVGAGWHGQLTLSPGATFVESLDVDSGGTLVVAHGGQPVVVYVDESLRLGGTISDGGDATHLLIVYTGWHDIDLYEPFRGTLVAPNARVTLHRDGSPHVGSFFASDLDVESRTSLQFAGFAHWSLFVAPIPSVTCVISYNPTAFGALFGYTNILKTPIVVPDGPDNQFVPSAPTFAPITTFAPGTHPGVTGVPLLTNSATWQVRNLSVVASRTTLPACTGDETRIVPLAVAPLGIDPDRGGPANPEAMSRLLPDVP